MTTALLLLTVFVNFVPYEKMQAECRVIRDNAEACYKGGVIILPALGAVNGRHRIDVTFEWLTWRELGQACDKPACERGHIIQATRDWNKAMECQIGQIVYRRQGWDTKACNEHCLLGHELLHAAGVTHP